MHGLPTLERKFSLSLLFSLEDIKEEFKAIHEQNKNARGLLPIVKKHLKLGVSELNTLIPQPNLIQVKCVIVDKNKRLYSTDQQEFVMPVFDVHLEDTVFHSNDAQKFYSDFSDLLSDCLTNNKKLETAEIKKMVTFKLHSLKDMYENAARRVLGSDVMLHAISRNQGTQMERGLSNIPIYATNRFIDEIMGEGVFLVSEFNNADNKYHPFCLNNPFYFLERETPTFQFTSQENTCSFVGQLARALHNACLVFHTTVQYENPGQAEDPFSVPCSPIAALDSSTFSDDFFDFNDFTTTICIGQVSDVGTEFTNSSSCDEGFEVMVQPRFFKPAMLTGGVLGLGALLCSIFLPQYFLWIGVNMPSYALGILLFCGALLTFSSAGYVVDMNCVRVSSANGGS